MGTDNGIKKCPIPGCDWECSFLDTGFSWILQRAVWKESIRTLAEYWTGKKWTEYPGKGKSYETYDLAAAALTKVLGTDSWKEKSNEMR